MEKQELIEKAKQEAAKGPKGKAQVYPVPPDYTHDAATGGAQLQCDYWWHCSGPFKSHSSFCCRVLPECQQWHVL